MDFYQALISILASVSLSVLSNFIVLRRYSLIGDAFSHVALPGVALALALSFDIFWGALIFLILGAIFIYLIEKKTSFYLESLVGFVFLFSLALGKIFIKDEELIESLFGNIKSTSTNDLILAILVLFLILGALFKFKKEFILITFSEDLAANYRINKHRVNFIFLFLVSLAISLGIKIVGILLVGSYLVIPPLFGMLFAKSLNKLILITGFYGFLTSFISVLLSNYFEFGPTLVLVQSIFFFLGFLFKNLFKNI